MFYAFFQSNFYDFWPFENSKLSNLDISSTKTVFKPVFSGFRQKNYDPPTCSAKKVI